MINFRISVPCRISLFGEHREICKEKYENHMDIDGETHEKVGLIAGIDLRTRITFKELSPSEDSNLQINFAQIHLSPKISIQLFQKFYSLCLKDMASLYEVLEFINYPYESDDHQIIMHAFFYLLILITINEQIVIKPFIMDISTEFMIGGELACPTSFVVCLAASLIHWSHLQKGDHHSFDINDLVKIRSYATLYEQKIPKRKICLVNVSACVDGGIIEYRTEENLNFIALYETLAILIVDSKQKQDLETQMQKVEELFDLFPEIAKCILAKLDNLTDMVCKIFINLKEICNNILVDEEVKNNHILQKYDELKICIRKTQKLLELLNVSNNNLEIICSIARKYGMHGKYTDIGNGRCAYIWCFPYVQSNIMSLSNELKLHGFDVVETKLARVSGVKIEN